MNVIGIDPGKEGCIASLSSFHSPLFPEQSETRLEFESMPLTDEGEWDPWAMSRKVHLWATSGVDRIVIEECHAFPGISASANAAVMLAYGMWLAAIAAKFPREKLTIVGAATWKKAMDVTVPIVKTGKRATKKEKQIAYKARKIKAVTAATLRFPNEVFATPKGRLLDGKAEAALIAVYGLEKI